ncbi:DUF4439 domain-containing protein [Brachybacterium alimentarium]|uniref:DUF4439 domain-containing protein n=1 Tax=Brachybacterium alimentarium TaxID=47845 RepID=UPI003FD12A83
MLLPIGSRSAAPSFTRRRLLSTGTAGVLALIALPGCGAIRFGGPATYTPPPPGIDDLYRVDLLELLDRALAGAQILRDAADAAQTPDPSLSVVLEDLIISLPIQRTALLTGAQAEREQDDSSDPTGSAAASSDDAPQDGAGMIAVLVELRELAVDAARQVSGSLARPIAALAAHTAWSAKGLQRATDAGEVPALRVPEDLVASREVPDTDPPSVGAEVDYHSTLQDAQQQEWYAGYVHEVLAARTTDDERTQHLALSDRHRERAEQLGTIAEEDGGPVVLRQAVYALPGGELDDELAAQLPTLVAQGLLVDHIALVGAAPFGRRPLPLIAALEAAETLVGRVETMDPLPSLAAEDLPTSDGG